MAHAPAAGRHRLRREDGLSRQPTGDPALDEAIAIRAGSSVRGLYGPLDRAAPACRPDAARGDGVELPRELVYAVPTMATRMPDAADNSAAKDDASDGAAPGTLFVVPTPIGDFSDLSLRALSILRSVDLIAAEDTRETLKLLRHHGISVPLTSYHDFNEQARTHELIGRLRGGARIALVSDSGTPLISDPGYRIVRAVSQAGLPLVSVPGPCAAITAAVASGLAVNQLLFVGFLPRKPGQRVEALRTLRDQPATLIFYEAPHRLLETLTAVRDELGDRPVAVCRSLTKRDEEVLRGRLDEVLGTLRARGTLYGEYTVVLGGAEDESAAAWERAGRLIARLLAEGLEPRRVRDIVADTLELPRGAVYDRILAGARSGSAGPAAEDAPDAPTPDGA